MTDLPSSWCATSVAAISGPLRYGYTASADRNADGPKMLRITDIQDGQVQWATVPRCEIEKEKLPNYLLSEGDIVFARTGGTVGKSFLIRNVPEDAVFASYLIQVSVEDGIDPRFPYWFFQSLNYWEQIALKKGGLQGNVNAKTLGSIDLPLPPLNEQRRIVERIEAMFERIDKGVENLRAARSTLALYRQSLLKSAFEGRLTADWRAKNASALENPKALLARIQKERDARYKAALADWQTALTNWRDGGEEGKKPAKPKRPVWPDFDFSDLSPLPDGWFHLPFEALAWSIRNGISAKPDGVGPLKIFRISAVRARAFDLQDFRRITDTDGTMDSFRLSYGDLVFTRYNGSRDYVGVSAMYRGDGTHVYPDKLIRCELKSDILNPAYIELATNCGETRAYLEKRIRTTAGQSGISGGDIKTMPVPICSPAEQTEISRILDARLDAADKLETEIDAALARADALRQSILKRAFAGDLVPQDPTDEPAPTLLARIKAEREATPNPKRKKRGAA